MQFTTKIRHTQKVSEDRKIHNPSDVYTVAEEEGLNEAQQEELWVLHLNTKLDVALMTMVHKGGANQARVHLPDVFRPMIASGAVSFIMVHNHPSGDPEPSPDDVRITRLIQEAGKLLEIDLLDHIIIGNGRFISLKERGFMESHIV